MAIMTYFGGISFLVKLGVMKEEIVSDDGIYSYLDYKLQQ